MTTDASGNLYVVGAFTGTIDFDPGTGITNAGPAVGSDIWFGKYTSTGDLVWAKALIGGDDDFGRDIALDNSGNIYITGYFGTQFPLDFDPGTGVAPPSVPMGLFFAKYSNNGVFQWVKTIGGTGANGVRSQAIALDGSGNIHIAGQVASSSGQSVSYDFDPGAGQTLLNTGNGSVFYAKYSNTGTIVWARNVGTANTGAQATDLALDGSGNLHITGYFSGSADFHPSSSSPVLNSSAGAAFVCKYNSSGNYVWTKQVTGFSGDLGLAIAVDASANVFAAGSRNVTGGNAYLARFSSSGTQTNLLNIGGSGIDAGQSIKIVGTAIYLGGYFSGASVNFNPNFQPVYLSTQFIDFFVAKYSTADLSCLWARNYDLQVTFTDFEINAIQLSQSKVVAAGNFRGSGDFTTCGDATGYNATTLDAFLVGYTLSDPGPSMGGPDAMCSPGQMTFVTANVPIGATVTWSISPASWVSSSSGVGPNFVTDLLPGAGPGTLDVTAVVSGSCGGPLYMQVSIGIPQDLCTPEILAMEPCATIHVTTCTGGLANYNWYIDGGFIASSPTNTTSLGIIYPVLLPGYHSLCVTTQNECGESTPSCTNFFTESCDFQLMVGYPNPSEDFISLTIDPAAKDVLDFEYSYSLQDKAGNLVRSGKTSFNSIAIDVKGLPSDAYYLKIEVQGKIYIQRVLIN